MCLIGSNIYPPFSPTPLCSWPWYDIICMNTAMLAWQKSLHTVQNLRWRQIALLLTPTKGHLQRNMALVSPLIKKGVKGGISSCYGMLAWRSYTKKTRALIKPRTTYVESDPLATLEDKFPRSGFHQHQFLSIYYVKKKKKKTLSR